MDTTTITAARAMPWNKGKLLGQKPRPPGSTVADRPPPDVGFSARKPPFGGDIDTHQMIARLVQERQLAVTRTYR